MRSNLLGSWEKIIDNNRNVVLSSHFDPWGNRMNATDCTTNQDGSTFAFHRGFTSHEHYDRFRIINMNVRLYDPVIGRFFSPDPQVQDPFSTQGLNRYTYCGNNPVMYIDEDGEFAWLIPTIISTVMGIYSGGVLANNGKYVVAGIVAVYDELFGKRCNGFWYELTIRDSFYYYFEKNRQIRQTTASIDTQTINHTPATNHHKYGNNFQKYRTFAVRNLTIRQRRIVEKITV